MNMTPVVCFITNSGDDFGGASRAPFVKHRLMDSTIQHGRWKLVYQPLETGFLLQLFNLETDPACQLDLSDSEPGVRDDLWARLEKFLTTDRQSLDPLGTQSTLA